MKYNGIDPRTLDPRISIAKEIPPGAPASELETIKGAEGEIVAGRTIKHGEYKVIVNVASRTRAHAWEVREKLAAWARSVDTVTHQLVPTHRPNRYYDAIFKDISEPEFTFGFGVITITFAVPRPVSKATISTGASWVTMDGPTASTPVTINGTTYTHPWLTITAIEAERVEVDVDGEICFAIDKTFAMGDVITIETEPPTVWVENEEGRQTAEKYLDYTVTDLDRLCHLLQPGDHRVTADGAKILNVQWREEYL